MNTAMSTVSAASPLAHLLIVDDDRVVLSTMASGLQSAGYRVSTAESVDEAQASLLSGDRPDLVILDVQMPDGGGLILAQRLRHLERIPFVMLSAFSDADTVEQANALGALGYLVKPLDLHQITPAIAAALQRAGDIRKLENSELHLQNALNMERDVNVAVGITMMQYRLSRSAAFEMLRNTSRARRRKLADIAREVVDAAQRMHGSQP
jgi:response regulator NasT